MMSLLRCGFFVLLITLALPFSMTAQPVNLSASHDTQFRRARESNLGRADGLLSIESLLQLDPGHYTVGSAQDCDIQNKHLAAHVGEFIVAETNNVVLRQSGAQDARLPQTTTSDWHLSTDKGWIHAGAVSFAEVPLASHAFWVIKDHEAADVISYPGLRWFAPASQWRVLARWTPYTIEHPLAVSLRSGRIVSVPAVGFAEFEVDGKSYRLDATEDDGHLFLVVGDKTNGLSTYGGGRFIENASASNGSHSPGTVLLDFNDLVNPYCAYSTTQNCPRPTKSDTLPIEIPAGEMQYPGTPGTVVHVALHAKTESVENKR